jgi:16S rRNA G1207 methylase RsmC
MNRIKKTNCYGRKFGVIYVDVPWQYDTQSKHIGEFVCAAEKYLKPGGKLVFHKR